VDAAGLGMWSVNWGHLEPTSHVVFRVEFVRSVFEDLESEVGASESGHSADTGHHVSFDGVAHAHVGPEGRGQQPNLVLVLFFESLLYGSLRASACPGSGALGDSRIGRCL